MTLITIRLERCLDGTVLATALEENELILCQKPGPDKVTAYRRCRIQVMGDGYGGMMEFRTDDRTGDLR